MDVNGIVENFRRIVTTQYLDFNGRTAREPFWYYVVACIVLVIAASILDGILFGGPSLYGYSSYHPQPLSSLLGLALLLPNLGIGARRLHDIDRSAWWLLLVLIPFVGWVVLIYWYVQPGTEGPNQFGADPKAG